MKTTYLERYNAVKSLAVGSLVVGLLAGSAAHAQWPQWGGPNRNFTVDGKGLASKWPDGGPKKIWSRELGDGFATIAVDDGLLYTMYRKDEAEYSVCLDAKTGATKWEHKQDSPTTSEMREFGAGPHATPLVVGDKVFTIGTNMMLHCFDKKTGKQAWSHDLVKEYEATVPGRGYSCSPIAYKDNIIVAVGSNEGKLAQGLVAFKQADGKEVWKNGTFEVSHSSAIPIKLGGKDQLVYVDTKNILGINPENGETLWSHAHPTQYGANLTTPLWDGKDKIYMSSAYDGGSRVIQLTDNGGKIEPKELWFSKKMRVHHANAVKVGEYLYGSSGDFGPAFFMGVNINTGEIAWRDRGFAKSTCLLAGADRVIILDEDGKLALAQVSPKELKVLSQHQVCEKTAWAAPTLVGTTLYVRDRKTITALDLG